MFCDFALWIDLVAVGPVNGARRHPTDLQWQEHNVQQDFLGFRVSDSDRYFLGSVADPAQSNYSWWQRQPVTGGSIARQRRR